MVTLFLKKHNNIFLSGIGLLLFSPNIDPFYSTYDAYDPTVPQQRVNGELGTGYFGPLKFDGPIYLIIKNEHFFLSQNVYIKPGNCPIIYQDCSFTFTGDSRLIVDLNSRDVIFDNVSISRISGERTDEGWLYQEYDWQMILHKEIKNEWRGLYEAKIRK